MTQHCFILQALRQDNIATGIYAYRSWSHVPSNASVYNQHMKLSAASHIPNNEHFTQCNCDSMEYSRSGEFQSSSASQEISRISRNPKVYYCVHKSLPLVSIMSHIIPAQTHRPTLILGDPFQYYPPIYVYVFQVVSIPQVSPTKPV